MKKWFIGIGALILLAVGLLIGYQFLSFPSEEYVEAALDAMYKQNYKTYQELTGAKEKEIAKAYEEGITIQAEVWKQYFGITDLSEKGEEELKEFIRMVYDYVEYDAISTKKKGENLVVTVKINPIAFYKILDPNKFLEEFRLKAEDGAYLKLSDSQYQEEYLSQLMKEYEKKFTNGDYETLEEVTCKLTLKKAGNEYIPNQDEFAKIDQALIAFAKK